MKANINDLEEWAEKLAQRDELVDSPRDPDEPDFEVLESHLGRDPSLAERDMFRGFYREARQ